MMGGEISDFFFRGSFSGRGFYHLLAAALSGIRGQRLLNLLDHKLLLSISSYCIEDYIISILEASLFDTKMAPFPPIIHPFSVLIRTPVFTIECIYYEKSLDLQTEKYEGLVVRLV